MNAAWLLLDALRAFVLLGVALTAYALLRRNSARVRQTVLASALVAVAVAPLFARAIAFSPAIPVVELVAFSVRPFAELEGAEIAPPEVSTHARLDATSSSSTATTLARAKRISLATWLAAAWAFGAGLILLRLARGIEGARKLARGAHREGSQPFAEVIARTMEEAGAVAEVAISDDVESPVVMGVFRPLVLMPPTSLIWTPSRWRVVLLHELAHVRRRDCLMSIVSQIVCALHWFDPLVWLARSRWRTACELAADEAVIAAGVQPSDYAEHLLGVAVGMSTDSSVVSSLAMAGRPSDLAHRVETIVSDGSPRPPSERTIRAVFGAAFTLTLAVACAGSRDSSSPIASSSSGAAALADRSSPSPLGANACEQPEVANATLAELVAQRTGSPVDRNELTIDPRLQRVADEEVARVVTTFHARMATAIILDPAKGEILAIANPDAARQAFITGSTMKSLTVAAALDANLVRVDQRFDCRPRANEVPFIQDPTPHESLELAEILAVSSNVGALRVYRALGEERFDRAFARIAARALAL